MEKQLTEQLSIVFEKKDFPKEKCEEIHNYLKGSQYYINSDIVLNIDDGLFLSFDFKDEIAYKGEMFALLQQVVNYLRREYTGK